MGELLVMGWVCDTIVSLIGHKEGGGEFSPKGKQKQACLITRPKKTFN